MTDRGNSRRTAAPDGAEGNVMRCLVQPFAADPDWYRRHWYSDRRSSAAAAAARPPARHDRPDGAGASWQGASASRIAVTLVLLVGIMAAASASYLLR